MNCIRGTSLRPASFIHHYLLHHDSDSFQLSLSLRSPQSSPSPSWLARCFPFCHRQGETYQRIWSPLSPARWYLSLQQRQSLRRVYVQPYSWSCLPTPAGIRSCGAVPGSMVHCKYRPFQIWFLMHVSRDALMSEVVFTSAPVPICSKIWDDCFDVITALGDPPIKCYPLPTLSGPRRCYPHAPRRCRLQQASDSAVWLCFSE